MIRRGDAATPDLAPVTPAPTPPSPVATQIETAVANLAAERRAVVQPWPQRRLAGTTSAEAARAIDALAADAPGLCEAAPRDHAGRMVVPNLTIENVKITPAAPDQVDATAATAFGINKAGNAAGDGRVALFVGINTPVGLATALVEGPATGVAALIDGRAAQEVNPEPGRPRLVGLPDLDAKGPNGANGGVAPTAYVATQEEFGIIFNRALRDRSPLTEEELRV